VTRLLRNRLGSTAVLSNLGVVGAPGLSSVGMYAAPSGPSAVAIGLASTASWTTLTVRTRSAEFTHEESVQLLDAVVGAFRR
jgi:hypothetical protein